VSDKVPDMKPEEPIVEEEEEEMAENENRRLEFVPTLSDQIHLLKPGFPIHSGPDTESESTLATSSNPTELPAPTHSQASEKGVSVESRRRGSAEPESKGAQEPSLRISSSEPPWIEMVRGEGGRRGEGGGRGEGEGVRGRKKGREGRRGRNSEMEEIFTSLH